MGPGQLQCLLPELLGPIPGRKVWKSITILSGHRDTHWESGVGDVVTQEGPPSLYTNRTRWVARLCGWEMVHTLCPLLQRASVYPGCTSLQVGALRSYTEGCCWQRGSCVPSRMLFPTSALSKPPTQVLHSREVREQVSDGCCQDHLSDWIGSSFHGRSLDLTSRVLAIIAVRGTKWSKNL